MPGSTRRSVPGVLGAVAACEAVGGVSGLAARKGISQWLPTLERPPFQPPDGVFGPVWTILYALIGISWYLVRTAPTETTPTGATPAGFPSIEISVSRKGVLPQLSSGVVTSLGTQVYQNSSPCWLCAMTSR